MTIADAGRFRVTVPPEVVVDTGQAGTSSTGTWTASSMAGYYGTPGIVQHTGWSHVPVHGAGVWDRRGIAMVDGVHEPVQCGDG